MSSVPNPASPDDDVTSAAENLLGIDLSDSRLPVPPIDLDDADLFGEPDAPQPEPVLPVAESAEPEIAAAEPDDDFGSDFGAGLDALPEPAPEPTRRPAPPAPAKAAVPARAKTKPLPEVDEFADGEAFDEQPPVKPPLREEVTAEAAPEEVVREEPAPEEAAPEEAAASGAPKDDSYWDALEGWDWGEESPAGNAEGTPRDDRSRRRVEGRSRGRSGGRTERKRTERAAPASPPRARSRPADNDFGSGLDDEPSAGPHEPETPSDASVFDLSPTESQSRSVEREREPRRRREPPAARPARRPVDAADEGDDFGAGLEAAPEEPEHRGEERTRARDRGGDDEGGEQRRGRRRRGRGRRRDGESGDVGESRPAAGGRREPAPVIDDADDESTSDAFEDEGDFEVQESRFQDVPTWAEAISLLVRSRSGGESSGGDRGRSRSGSSESGERSGGGRGRGRGGRRGGGRRRSE